MALGIQRTLLYEEVVSELYRMIDQGQIKLGEAFPSERVLVDRWNISRNVLREAFHVLEARGLVTSQQGRGRFLRAIPKENPPLQDESLTKNLERYSLVEIYQTRQCLESKAVELIAVNATQEDLDEIERTYNDLYERFHKNNNTIGEFDIHRMYAAKSKNQYLEQFINIAFKTTLEFMTSSFLNVLTQHTIRDSLIDHGEIIRALQAQDAEKARAIMTAHIQHTINMLCEGF